MKIQPWKSHMMLAASPNCCRLLPSVARYFSGSATSAQKASRMPTTKARTRYAVTRPFTSTSRRHGIGLRFVLGHLVVLLRRRCQLLPQPAPPDEDHERPEEPPLDRVEQVADRGETAGVRQGLEVGGGQPVHAVPRDRVGAVEVLVDVLDQVGDPQLG